MSIEIQKCKIVEIALTGNTKTYNFGTQEQLLKKKITGIIIRKTGKSKNNSNIFDPKTTGILKLKASESAEIPVEIPCELLIYEGSYPPLALRPLAPQVINWNESTVEFSDVPTDATVFQMTVFYAE